MYAESTTKPVSLEVTKNTVYVRENFREIERTSMDGIVKYWAYEEYAFSRDEFNSSNYVDLMSYYEAMKEAIE